MSSTPMSSWARGHDDISDEFASGKHARFWVTRCRWYVEEVGSTNGTWLNGRRIHAAQLLKGATRSGSGTRS